MAEQLEIDNFGAYNIQEKTYVNADYTSGTALTVKSTQNAAVDLYILAGGMGQEATEIARIGAVPSATGLTLVAGLNAARPKYTDVTIIKANQIKVYRAANVDGSTPADGSFSTLATIDIDPDELQTTYVDSTGGSDYWYKFIYFNSQTTVSSSLADSTAVRGGSISVYATVYQIRDEAGFNNNPYVSDANIDEARIEAQDHINSRLADTYTVPFETASPTIQHITKLLAAGYLLKKEWGQGSIGTTDAGQSKIDEANSELDKIIANDLPLVDEDGNEIATRNGISGWPNADTATTAVEDGGAKRNFRMGNAHKW